MAIEWYLMKSPYDQLSGFENEALDNFAQEGFNEILDTNIATNIEICNYDLSVCKQIRGVVQNNVQDTRLKTLSRALLAPIGSCKAGMYVKYKDRYWIITGLVDNNTMYEKAIMLLCNYYLTWMNRNGLIIQRWTNISSASQYNNGETSVKYYNVRSNQLLIITPDDDECLLLSSGIRFIIDGRCKIYEKELTNVVDCDTSKPVITYELTRADSVLYDYQDSGHYEFLAYQGEQHEDDGYYIVDGKGYWLCGNPVGDDKTTLLSSKIECDSPEIYNGIDAGIFTARFYDKDGNLMQIEPHWTINCDFAEELNIEYVDTSICISANNKKLINKSFELSLDADGYETTSVVITIRAFV
jgi:hypothetical protein